MGGCCLVVLLLLISPRLFLVGVWLLSNWYNAFDSRLVAILGWLFLGNPTQLPPPGPRDCGPDPTTEDDPLGCDRPCP